jgi:hypothetical protein
MGPPTPSNPMPGAATGVLLRVRTGEPQAWNRTHFFAVAALLMRRILVDEARGRLGQRGPRQAQIVELLGSHGQEDDTMQLGPSMICTSLERN